MACVPEYSCVYGPAWAAAYTPHITLAYGLDGIPADKHEAYLAVLAKAADAFRGGPIQYSFGAVYAFSDMDHFVVPPAPSDGK